MSMFTALFAVSRTTGWVSQWNEMIEDANQKIGRPRQLYTGKARARRVWQGFLGLALAASLLLLAGAALR